MNLSLLLYVLFSILGLLVLIPTAIQATLQIRDQLKNRQGNQAMSQAPASNSNLSRFSRLRNVIVPLLLPILAVLLTASGIFNIIQQNQIATLTNQITILNQRLDAYPQRIPPSLLQQPASQL